MPPHIGFGIDPITAVVPLNAKVTAFSGFVMGIAIGLTFAPTYEESWLVRLRPYCLTSSDFVFIAGSLVAVHKRGKDNSLPISKDAKPTSKLNVSPVAACESPITSGACR